MALRLLFFAQCSDWVRSREMSVSIARPTSIESLLAGSERLRLLLDQRKYVRVAVNCEYSQFDAEVKDGDEVAFMPPFSGG